MAEELYNTDFPNSFFYAFQPSELYLPLVCGSHSYSLLVWPTINILFLWAIWAHCRSLSYSC